ncbi:hypothetical protein [Kosakonia pseudosacchari]|uniref:hypothetical protein n=1 Tax=Kosakonia pseudosacchari TaxID=1646340 RepID=UPI001D154213|nr:hypothetical protein [Kosakonia pseudosacchari]
MAVIALGNNVWLLKTSGKENRVMSKIVVVLVPGGASQFLTVEDGETSVQWVIEGLDGGAASARMPIETYYCEGEEFYFARVESLAGNETTPAMLN